MALFRYRVSLPRTADHMRSQVADGACAARGAAEDEGAGVWRLRRGGFSRLSHGKEALDAKLTLPHWTHHDLRRTAATRMADIGVQPHVIEAILNHVSGHKGGIAGVYNRATYAVEKADALSRWDEHIAGRIGGAVITGAV